MNGCPYGKNAFRVVSGFGPCRDPLTGVFGRKMSVRLSGTGDKTVTALYSGRVVRISVPEKKGGGDLTVTVASPGGIEVMFAGLVCLFVRAGDLVKAGERLGCEGGEPVTLTVLCKGFAINPLECLGVPNLPGVYAPCGSDAPGKAVCGWRRGDLVRIGNPVRYGTGRRFSPYYELYEVMGVSGDRVTVGIGGEEIAYVRGCDLYPV